MITDKIYTERIKNGNKMREFLSRLDSLGINKKKIPLVNKILDEKAVNVVVDIRESTFYKSKEGFHPNQFKENQERYDRKYVYIQELGNPYHKKLQAEVKAAQKNEKKLLFIDEKGKALYLDYLQQENVEINDKIRNPFAALKKLYKQIAHTREGKSLRFCFICYCDVEKPNYTEAGKCHRFWLIYALKELKCLELGYDSYFKDNKKINKWINRWQK